VGSTRRHDHPLRILTRKLLVYSHRWLGIVLGALFAGWFISGVVMMYTRMPALSPAERRARLPVLDFSTARVSPGTTVADDAIDAVRFVMRGGRPVYRVEVRGRFQDYFADDGASVPPADEDRALAEARRFAPEHAASLTYDGYLASPDQWTLETSRLLPMHRIRLGDDAGTRLYVAATTGEVVLKTTARERWWAYPGAILHWLYLTPLRRNGPLWAQIIIWTSVAGTVMCLAGLVWGIWRFSPGRRYRLKRIRSLSPYSGWMHWHHYAGLVFGAATLTWIFSGLLSMDPWDWHPGTAPTAQHRAAFTGGPLRVADLSAAAVQQSLQGVRGAKEAGLVQFRGRVLLASDAGIVALDTGKQPPPLAVDDLLPAAKDAAPGVAIEDAQLLDRYDSYYYDRDGELRLPVVRVRYLDPQRTWLYVDPQRGTLLRKEERLTRLNRWLYHGFHSLDFPFLYHRRPLWDIVVILLSAGGLGLTLTTLVPALRRFRRHLRRLASRF